MQLRKTITKYLKSREEIIFAYLFGSFVNGERFRDIDVGIYTSERPDLLTLGRMQTEMMEMTGEKVDVIHLNPLPTCNPALAYRIVTTGELLFTRDPERHTRYKKQSFLTYFDTAPLRKQMEEAFDERLKSGQFGKVKK